MAKKNSAIDITVRDTDVAWYEVAQRRAWEFMREIDAAGLKAGFPALRANNTHCDNTTVQVGISNNSDREIADAIAKRFGSTVVRYAFAGSKIED